ncbi:kinase-like domain-containing protein [Hyaloraphidium curvatum]|nr:kinase-like domain-containing protein [Hyaloraphidium curvatum]
MLDLSKCQLGGEGIRALCQAVLMNDTLRNLATGGGYPELSKALSSSERAANAQRMRRTLEARDQPPQGLALPLRKWLRMADLDVDRTCTLGSGGFGKVFRGRYLDLDVAVKEPLLRGDEEAEAVLEAEIAASVDLPQHPNVADILGYHIQPTFLVTRLYTGDLAGFLRQRGWNRTLALRLLADAAQGVRALHAAGIVHADLKPGNVLVDLAPGDPDDRAVAKIADFGLARSRNRVRGAQGTAYEYVGFGGFSLRYAPPEQLRGEGFGRASDIWSFGMLCYTILSEDTEPYAGLSHVSIMFHIEQGTLPNPLLRWDDWELIRWICAKDKLERPSVEEIAARLRSMAAAAAEESPAGSAASSTEAPALNEMDRTVSVAASVPDVTRSVG